MAQSLYSKYRPKVFADVVGQKHILQTLQNAISSDKISHAYMFCGPRGTGKTTMARLLAKACMCKCATDKKSPSVNFCGKCEDCDDIATGTHPDVYELDAASRTGVDNVREEIISRVGFAATRGDKKIYIIDEVHMLSTAAFNALLKTLEEPPEHVIFILCTTDPQKVPETILSRCQRFDFRQISTEDILVRLKIVCDQENVQAEDSALEIIAQNAQGAMRNALTNLEQAIAFTQGLMTKDNVAKSFAIDTSDDLVKLIEFIGMRDLPQAFSWIEKINEKGADYDKLCANLTKFIRDMYVSLAGGKVALDSDIEEQISLFTVDRLHRIMIVLGELSRDLKISTNPRLSFEIAMAKICNPKHEYTVEALAERISDLEIVATAGDLSHHYEHKEEVKEQEVSEQNDEEDEDEVLEDLEEEQNEPEQEDVVEEEDEEEEEPQVLNLPEVHQETDFSQVREELKAEANVSQPVTKQSLDLSNNQTLQKLWHNAFSNIRRKFPAFGATLLTASPSFDENTKQFILTFPQSASFSVGVLKKPDSIEKIKSEIKAVMGEEVGFNIEIDASNNEEFNPSFSNKFREEKDVEEEDEKQEEEIPVPVTREHWIPEVNVPQEEPSSGKKSLTDILNDSGAYNITEE